MSIRETFYNSSFLNKLKIQKTRDIWVNQQLKNLPKDSIILDAGCGSQRYRESCRHLNYKAQDFGKYSQDDMEGFDESIGNQKGFDPSVTSQNSYVYGELDYVGDICSIQEEDSYFDAILCTEVLEHLTNPRDAIKELVRVLKLGGIIILTAPTHSLKHMDPYHFYTGFTNRFYEQLSEDFSCELISMEQNLDYYGVMALELARSISKMSFLLWPFLLPAFFVFYLIGESPVSKNAYTYGYHVILKKTQ